jgi:cell division protein FtsB
MNSLYNDNELLLSLIQNPNFQDWCSQSSSVIERKEELVMLLVRRLAQRFVMLAAISVPLVAPVTAQSVSAADIEKLQESVRAMREQYEQRINSLERKIETLQKVQAVRPQDRKSVV